jgi:intracellular sulfur oxidation DsrE/DsrF family protein
MARRVVSVVRAVSGSLRATEPVLEANAYAVAEDVDLTLVLRDEAVELAVIAGQVAPGTVAGVGLPPAVAAQELQGLVESGVAIVVDEPSLARFGVERSELADGVEVVDEARVGELLRGAEAVLMW